MADDQTKDGARNVGKILEIQGVVVDAVFTEQLPEINTALRIVVPEREGRPAIEVVAEVQQHLGDDRVRAVAMDSTDGIPRGVEVIDTGGPISVPVGNGTLGRLFNVLGETSDRVDKEVEAIDPAGPNRAPGGTAPRGGLSRALAETIDRVDKEVGAKGRGSITGDPP